MKANMPTTSIVGNVLNCLPPTEIESDADVLSWIAAELESIAARVRTTAEGLRVKTTGGPAEIPVEQTSVGAYLPMGYWYAGTFRRTYTATDIYLGILRCLWRDFPSRREAMATAMREGARDRKYVALSREELFARKTPRWTNEHSIELIDGWHVDKNLSSDQMRRHVARAIRVAELVPGRNIAISWSRRRVDLAAR